MFTPIIHFPNIGFVILMPNIPISQAQAPRATNTFFKKHPRGLKRDIAGRIYALKSSVSKPKPDNRPTAKNRTEKSQKNFSKKCRVFYKRLRLLG